MWTLPDIQMPPGRLKAIGIACFVICAVLLFVAVERYHHHAVEVADLNRLAEKGPFGQLGRLPVRTPAATTYSVLFACLFALGGAVCFVYRKRMLAQAGGPSQGPADG